MLDKDMEELENFLRGELTQDNDNATKNINTGIVSIHLFEKLVDEFFSGDNTDSISEKLVTAGGALDQSYYHFDEIKEDVVKEFAITLVLSKKITEMTTEALRKAEFVDEDKKKAGFEAMKGLLNLFKDEANTLVKYFEMFNEYADEILEILE